MSYGSSSAAITLKRKILLRVLFQDKGKKRKLHSSNQTDPTEFT